MKPIWKSKTWWFNAALLALGTLEATAPILRPHLGEATTSVVLFVATFGNLYLRQVTTMPTDKILPRKGGDGA